MNTKVFVKWYWVFVLSMIIWSPLFLLGESAYLTVGDVLDCEWLWLHLLEQHDLLFASRYDVIPEPMGGIRVGRIHSPFNLNRIIWYIFSGKFGYAVAVIIYRLIAIWGAWSLFDLWKKAKGQEMGVPEFVLVLGWGLLPTSNLYGLSALGLPLLVFLFECLRIGRNVRSSLLILFLFGFTVHLAMFLIAAFLIGVYFCVVAYKHGDHKFLRRVILGGSLLCGGLALGNWWQLVGLIDPIEISHRSERDLRGGFMEGWNWTWYVLRHGHYHSGKIPGLYVLFVGVLGCVVSAFKRKSFHLVSLMGAFLAVIFLFHLARPLSFWLDTSFLKQFDLQRVNFLLPILALLILFRSFEGRYWLRLLAFGGWVLLLLASNQEIKANWKQVLLKRGDSVEYLDTLLDRRTWDEILLDLEGYNRVGVSGLPMWILQFHGIRTLGGYQNDYPLDYKHQFRRVISEELMKNESMLDRFDSWGNSCWLQSSEVRDLGLNKDEESKVKRGQYPEGFQITPDWNWSLMQDMGATHILSAYPINSEALSIVAVKKAILFDIYIYQIELDKC